MIAHRLSTIRRANAIFVVKNGKIAESGTHEQLLQAGGLYTLLHELQFNHEDELSMLAPDEAAAGLVGSKSARVATETAN